MAELGVLTPARGQEVGGGCGNKHLRGTGWGEGPDSKAAETGASKLPLPMARITGPLRCCPDPSELNRICLKSKQISREMGIQSRVLAQHSRPSPELPLCTLCPPPRLPSPQAPASLQTLSLASSRHVPTYEASVQPPGSLGLSLNSAGRGQTQLLHLSCSQNSAAGRLPRSSSGWLFP